MMRPVHVGFCAIASLVFACMSLMAAPASADGLIQRLPEDGAWVKYYVLIQGPELDDSAECILRSVGKTTVDGEPCRWIEMEILTGSDAGNEKVTQKFLIPEARLKAGENPSAHVRKWWTKRGDRPVQAEDVNDPELALFFGGPLDESKRLDEKQRVDWQQGRLECDVVTGSTSMKDGGGTAKLLVRVCLHNDVPFGVAEMEVRFQVPDNAEQRLDLLSFSVMDAGTGAKSTIAEE